MIFTTFGNIVAYNMPGLTDKLFDKLIDKEQNIELTVNNELLESLV